MYGLRSADSIDGAVGADALVNGSLRADAFRGSDLSRLSGAALSRGSMDGWLFGSMLLLLSVSLLMVFSTTAVVSQEIYGDSSRMMRSHVVHVLTAFAVALLFSRVNPEKLYRWAPILFFVTTAMLALTLIPGIGHVAGGARRWLILGPIRLQPGELAKLSSLIYFASYVARHRSEMERFKPGVMVPGVLLAVTAMLLLAEPDFGTTVVILLVTFCQLLLVTRLAHLALIGSVAGAAVCALVVMSPYRFKRFTAFMDPFGDPSASGYQLIQSLIAVGSGGLMGEGLGAGKQKLFYLPAAHTDFIFAVIAEELGIFGAIAVLALFLLILVRGFKITSRLNEDPFLSSLALGCTCLIVVPALLNMGVVLGLLPTKGMVLPLVAYGGTAMVVHAAALGILLRLSRLEL